MTKKVSMLPAAKAAQEEVAARSAEQDRLVRYVESMLERVKAGEIIGLGVLAAYDNGDDFGTAHIFAERTHVLYILGGIEVLKQRVIHGRVSIPELED
jgi:hypothetical protein